MIFVNKSNLRVRNKSEAHLSVIRICMFSYLSKIWRIISVYYDTVLLKYELSLIFTKWDWFDGFVCTERYRQVTANWESKNNSLIKNGLFTVSKNCRFFYNTLKDIWLYMLSEKHEKLKVNPQNLTICSLRL